MTRITLTTRVGALESAVVDLATGQAEILALLKAGQPAKVTRAKKAPAKAAAKADEGFVTWIRDTAEARAERKARNAELAAALRKVGLPTSGPVWEAAKAMRKLDVRKLRAIAKANA